MLKLQIRNSFENTMKEVEFEDFKLSSDLTSFSVLCDDWYNINTNDKVLLKTNPYDEGFYTTVKAVDVITLIGEAIIPTHYDVHTDGDVKYIKFSNNKYYYNRSWFGLENSIVFPADEDYYITLSGDVSSQEKVKNSDGVLVYEQYKINTDGVSVNVPQKYYISGDTINVYDGTEYDVFITKSVNNDGFTYNASICDESGNSVSNNIIIYEGAKIKRLLTFDIENDILINIENAKHCTPTYYTFYQDEMYKVNYDMLTDKQTVIINDTLSGETISYESEGDLYDSKLLTINDSDKTICQVYTKYVDSEEGNRFFLYLDDMDYQLHSGDIIIATSDDISTRTMPLVFYGTEYGVIANATFYPISNENDKYDFVVIGNEEYELIYTAANKGYVMYQDTLLVLNINGDTATRDTFDEIKLKGESLTSEDGYQIKHYRYVLINDIKHKVYQSYSVVGDELSENPLEYIEINLKTTYRINIEYVEEANVLRCKPIIEGIYDAMIDGDLDIWFSDESTIERSVCNDIVYNLRDFVFYIENQKYGTKEQLNINAYYGGQQFFTLNAYDLSIYKIQDYLEVGVPIGQMMGSNINKEDLLNNLFLGLETDKTINRIVDMDKDVYYPYFKGSKQETHQVGGECSISVTHKGETETNSVGSTSAETTTVNIDQLINKITFNLHFRTRSLDTWKINEDYTKVNTTTDLAKVLPTFDNTMTNWFCTDMYSEKQIDKKYYDSKYIASACTNGDLITYLNFSNDDIFYQKKKVKKSFIRLLFFDSPIPDNQSLLYQATVWLDGTELFKKYMDGMYDKTYYRMVSDTESDYITVDGEPIDDKNKFTFNDAQRLSTKFTITNRYNTKHSAEGYYLYLFKELVDTIFQETTEKKCQATIYMKVIFNHAGEGQSCLFMLPKDKDNKTIKEFTTTKLNELKEGVSLANVLNAVYIPITLEYDKTINQYKYYFNEDDCTITQNNENEIIFNLFEIKLKDESNSQENQS